MRLGFRAAIRLKPNSLTPQPRLATSDARDPSPAQISPAAISAERSTASPKRQKPHSSSAAPEASAPETTSENPPSPAVMAGVGGSGSGGGGGGDAEMGGWTGLLHSSTKLLEQAAPTPHFPPLQVRARRRPPFLPRSFSPFSLSAPATLVPFRT